MRLSIDQKTGINVYLWNEASRDTCQVENITS